MRLFFLVLFFSVLSAFAASANNEHDIHLSLSEIRYNETSSSFEVAIRIFIDDLELALQKKGVTKLKIGTPAEDPIAEEHIAAYLRDKFSVSLDGVPLKGNFIGKEISEDLIAVWCYVEFPRPNAQAKKCTVSNNILLEVYDDQRNIMDIRMTKAHKDYTILDHRQTTWSYIFS